jgi:putative transposase
LQQCIHSNIKKKTDISMTEETHCYENAMAERVNGILKDAFYIDQPFMNIARAKRAAKKCNQIIQRGKITLIFRFQNTKYGI